MRHCENTSEQWYVISELDLRLVKDQTRPLGFKTRLYAFNIENSQLTAAELGLTLVFEETLVSD